MATCSTSPTGRGRAARRHRGHAGRRCQAGRRRNTGAAVLMFGYDGEVKARRCSICSIQYPPYVEVCRVCDGETFALFKSGPDADWEDQVQRRLTELGRSLGEGVLLPADPQSYKIA